MSKLTFKYRDYDCTLRKINFCDLCVTRLAPSIDCNGYVCGEDRECGNVGYQIAYGGIVTDEYNVTFYKGLIELTIDNYIYYCESLSIDGEPVFEEEMKRWQDEH